MPEFVIFQEVVVGKRAYMRGVTALDPSCLLDLATGTCVTACVRVRMYV